MALALCHLVLSVLACRGAPSLMDCVEDEQAFQGPVPTSVPKGKLLPGFPQLSLLQPSRQLGLSVHLYSVLELEVSSYLNCVWGGPRDQKGFIKPSLLLTRPSGLQAQCVLFRQFCLVIPIWASLNLTGSIVIVTISKSP